jgi:hypothetical protein
LVPKMFNFVVDVLGQVEIDIARVNAQRGTDRF